MTLGAGSKRCGSLRAFPSPVPFDGARDSHPGPAQYLQPLQKLPAGGPPALLGNIAARLPHQLTVGAPRPGTNARAAPPFASFVGRRTHT